MKSNPLLRAAPLVILVAAAYALGRWNARPEQTGAETPTSAESSKTSAATLASSEPIFESTSASEAAAEHEPASAQIVAKIEEIAAAARSMAVPDARTYDYFERLTLEELPSAIGYIRGMPPGNEQDVLFIMTTTRWAQLDGREAVSQAKFYPALGTRANAVLGAYESWARVDAIAAFDAARAEAADGLKSQAMTAVISGAATRDPRQAIALWQQSPEAFRESPAGQNAAGQIASAAYGTGQGETIRTLVAELDEGKLRTHLINALAREWGGHYPEEVLGWLKEVIPADEERQNVVNTMFLALAQRDPSLAAVWATEYPDEGRRSEFIAAAVQEWARLDSPGAETWVNEQPSGRYLDGASYAMAVHFMSRQEMARSFAWIRRISIGEMRAQMLGTLGKLWSDSQPLDFKSFLEETSLSPVEVEMLTAKIQPAS